MANCAKGIKKKSVAKERICLNFMICLRTSPTFRTLPSNFVKNVCQGLVRARAIWTQDLATQGRGRWFRDWAIFEKDTLPGATATDPDVTAEIVFVKRAAVTITLGAAAVSKQHVVAAEKGGMQVTNGKAGDSKVVNRGDFSFLVHWSVVAHSHVVVGKKLVQFVTISLF